MKKLKLNKTTVANLNSEQLNQILAGKPKDTDYTGCCPDTAIGCGTAMTNCGQNTCPACPYPGSDVSNCLCSQLGCVN